MTTTKQPLTLWKALYNYNIDGSGEETDLAFHAGDIICAAPNVHDSGWLYGYLEKDLARRHGEVPANFVEAFKRPQAIPPAKVAKKPKSKQKKLKSKPVAKQQSSGVARAGSNISAPILAWEGVSASSSSSSSAADSYAAPPFTPTDKNRVAVGIREEHSQRQQDNLPCPDGVDFEVWRSYPVDSQHQYMLERNLEAFARQLQREETRRIQGMTKERSASGFGGTESQGTRTKDDPLLRLAPSAVCDVPDSGTAGSQSSASGVSAGSMGVGGGRRQHAQQHQDDEEERAARELAQRLQMEEIQRAHGGQLQTDDAMHMLADALENAGQSNAVGSTFGGADSEAQVVGSRLSQEEIRATPVAAYVPEQPEYIITSKKAVRYVNRARVDLNRSIMYHEDKQKFALRVPDDAHNQYTSDITAYGNFVIFDVRGTMVARLDCLNNKNTFILREITRPEADQFAPGLAGIKFKTLSSKGYKFRYALFACAKNWRDPFIVPTSDWMKQYLEIEAKHLVTQVSPASDILHGQNYNVLVSSAKYHVTANESGEPLTPYIESVKQCIFIHPQSGTACIIGKLSEYQFDVLWNKQLTALQAFAMGIATVRAKT